MNDNATEQKNNADDTVRKRPGLMATVLTTGVWALIGSFAGKAFGSFGDGGKDGIGSKVGRLGGALVGGSIALATLLFEKNKDDKDSKPKPAAMSNEGLTGADTFQQSVTSPVASSAVTLPNTAVQAASSQGTVLSAPQLAPQV